MKLLLYCTKAKPYLTKGNNGKIYPSCCISNGLLDWHVNGKIVAECDFEVEEIKNNWYPCDIVPSWDKYFTYYRTNKIEPKEFYEKSCLNWEQLNQYLNDYDSQKFEGGYAIHIKNLHIFDEPRELSDYITKQCQYAKCSTCRYGKNNIRCSTIDTPITKAPQNMMKVYNRAGEYHILISIRPEWLCKILNGEKTIEVRKKILKEMRD